MTNTTLAAVLLLILAVPIVVRCARELERQKRYRWLMQRYTHNLLAAPVKRPD